MEPVYILGVAGLVAAACFLVARGRPAFIVVIAGGKGRIHKGQPPPGFIQEAEDICREAGIAQATIRGYARNRSFVLTFSPHLSREIQQRFRNVLGVHC